MRVPTIYPRRQVETTGVYYKPDEDDIDELQAENESLRKRLLNAHDRANELEDARDAAVGKNLAILDIVVDLTADMGITLGTRHLDALPLGAVIRTDRDQAWTHIGVDTVSGHYRSYDDGNPIDVYEFHLVPGWGPIAWLRMRRLLKEGWEYAGKMNVGLLRTAYFVNRPLGEGDQA